MKILHFADAHIDMANYGRHDPETGLPLRVLDFLKSLDTIIDTALAEKVDLVIFAGDAYKDRSPAPTFQREWGKRIMRLSRAGIPGLLLLGNHDLSPALGRAHAVQEFDTLQVAHIRVLDKPCFLSAQDLALPVQVLALPWIPRSGLIAALDLRDLDIPDVYEKIEEKLTALVQGWLSRVDPTLPVVLTAHASVQGAKYGTERMVMLGTDLVLSGSLVRNPHLDYVALGHIHRAQDLNPGAHPPVVYPGSIERVDFGEADDEKYFVIADVNRGQTTVDWRKLEGIRPFFDCYIELTTAEGVLAVLQGALPSAEKMSGSIVRLTVTYKRELDTMIDEAALRVYTASAFEFHLVKRPQTEVRIRLPADQTVSSLSPLDLLEQYWHAMDVDEGEIKILQKLAARILNTTEDEETGTPI